MASNKRNSLKRKGVRGPNSALTEFLRNEGITNAFRQQQAGLYQSTASLQREAADTEPDIVVVSGLPQLSENDMDIEKKEIRIAGARNRRYTRASRTTRKRSSSFSDHGDSNSDDEFLASENENRAFENDKKVDEEDICVECGDTFGLTVYSRYIKDKGGYICETCNNILKDKERSLKRNQANARRKRKQIAQALLDKQTIRVPRLLDVCVRAISKNISDVDAFGDIGHLNMAKISRILSKNRSLNSSTLGLFLHPELRKLELWDCSNIDSEALNKIASFSPKLESLTLFMCGQLHNDNLRYYASNLPHLCELFLNGPFLISDSMWIDFFLNRLAPFRKLEVRNTHRFGNGALETLLSTCGEHLQLLKLSRLDGLSLDDAYTNLPGQLKCNVLTDLELSYPHTKNLINDDLMIEILKTVGCSLILLNVDGCTALTERFLLEGVAKFCPVLLHLSMKGLRYVSDDGFAEAFRLYSTINNGGLISVDLTKCTELGDRAIYSLFSHSSSTLVELKLNSIYKLSKDMLFQAFTEDHHPCKVSMKQKCKSQNINTATSEQEDVTDANSYYHHICFPLLTTFDFGFVRAVDNEIMALTGDVCPQLSVLEVSGNNRCNFNAINRQGIMIIGRQGDEI